MTRRRLDAACLAVLVLLAVVLQVSVLSQFAVRGVVPDLALVLVVAVGLARGPRTGALTGFGAGLLLDIAPPADHVAGRWALALVVVGYLAGRVRQDASRSSLVALATVAAGSFVGTSVFADRATIILLEPGEELELRAISHDKAMERLNKLEPGFDLLREASATAHRALLQVDRRQVDRPEARQRYVVEPDHRQLLGHRQTGLQRRLHHAQRVDVAAAQDRGGRTAKAEKVPAGGDPAFEAVIAVEDRVVVHFQSKTLGFRQESSQTLAGGAAVGSPPRSAAPGR